MSVVTRLCSVALLTSCLLAAGPACAQTSSNEGSGSSWTDPPARDAAAPKAPAAVEPAAPKPTTVRPPAAAEAPAPSTSEPARKAAEAPPAATPAQRAAALLGVKPVVVDRHATGWRRRAQVRRMAVAQRATRVSRVHAIRQAREARRRALAAREKAAAWRETSVAGRHVRRRAASRMRQAPMQAAGWRVDPYDGRSYAPAWTSRRLTGWEGLLGDGRAARLARARAAGYSIMRLRTYEYPDGSQVQRLEPFDD